MIDDSDAPARRAFFGRRIGHKLRPNQRRLFEELLPRLAVDLAQSAPRDLATLFTRPVTAVQLEIGFGGAEHLIAQAQAKPDVGFIGCEAYVNGMAKALMSIDALGLDNIRLHFADAIELLAWLHPGSLARVDLLYPDPWPKRRHWKRRFVQPANIAEIARVLRPGGEFRFASDIEDYVAWTLRLVTACPDFAWTAERADDWRRPWPDFVGTRYEAKAKREGRTPCYLSFRRR